MSYVSQTITDYDDRYQNLKNHILYSLGWPTIRIELTDNHLNVAIMDAVTRYYDRAAHDIDVEIVNVETDNTVTVPPTIKKSMIENVIFPMAVTDAWTRGMFISGTEDVLGKYVIPQQSWSNILDNFDMVGYYLFLRRMEDFKKIVGIDRHWGIINGKIHLYPASASIAQVGIVYKSLSSDDDYEGTNWIKDWATAKATSILGIIRRKMSGFTTAGGNIAADGEALVSESRETMRELEEKLNGLQKPLPFLQL